MKYYKNRCFFKDHFSLKGFSLIEIMVVISIFALLGVLVTQSLALSIRGSKKSEASAIVRSNLASAASIVERQLRNADSITCSGEENKKRIDYVNEFGKKAYFRCNSGENILSDDKPLIDANTVVLIKCLFVCTEADEYTLDSIQLTLEGMARNSQGPESAVVSFETKILLRNY